MPQLTADQPPPLRDTVRALAQLGGFWSARGTGNLRSKPSGSGINGCTNLFTIATHGAGNAS